LRTVESGIAFAEHWIGVVIAARASALAGRRVQLDRRWSGWAPGKARGWDSLMQRYARCRALLGMIERLAQRRAVRMARAAAANPLGASLAHHDDGAAIAHVSTSSILAVAAFMRAGAGPMRIRAPP
jgi:hypothetical protein